MNLSVIFSKAADAAAADLASQQWMEERAVLHPVSATPAGFGLGGSFQITQDEYLK